MTTTVASGEQLDLLERARAEQRAARDAEVRLLECVVELAASHPPVDEADRAMVKVGESVVTGDRLQPLNGEGVPEVSALAVARLAATLRLSPVAGRMLVAEAMELAWRLPRLWERVRAGGVPAWQARRVAKATLGLSQEAAAFVDRHVSAVTGSIGVASLDRLVEEAIIRHDRARVLEQIGRVTERRRFDVELDRCDLLGLVPVHGVLDLPDAIAIDAAVAHGAERLAAWGSSDNRDGRRARAVGDLAREHLRAHGEPAPTSRAVWDEETRTLTPVPSAASSHGAEPAPSTDGGVRGRSRRELMLHVHLTDREVVAAGSVRAPRRAPLLGRVEHARTGDRPITAETIREWCGASGTRITVLPMLDVADAIHHDAYEIPDRLREQVIARDHTCVYPGCGVHGRRADVDHIQPYDHDRPPSGGATATDNLALLCRAHHRLKTTGRISYRMTAPGRFEWDLGTGEVVVRDHRGTHRDRDGTHRDCGPADPADPACDPGLGPPDT